MNQKEDWAASSGEPRRSQEREGSIAHTFFTKCESDKGSDDLMVLLFISSV